MIVRFEALSRDNIIHAKQFILKHEPDIISAAEEINALEQGAKPRGEIYIGIATGKEIIAVLYINNMNILFPYWQPQHSAGIIEGIEKDTAVRKRIAAANTITGKSEIVAQISDFITKHLTTAKRIMRMEYLLMTLAPQNIITQRASAKDTYPFKVERATLRHIFRILPLHTEYLREEVNINYSPVMRHREILNQLHNSLKRYTHYITWHNAQIIAKANSNIEGYNCAQLGGIFTRREYRNQGVGYQCVMRLCTSLFSRYQLLILFVKKENGRAISLYRNIGFQQRGSYTIHYLS